MKLSVPIHHFFVQYLPQIKGSGSATIKSYKETFKLLLPFAAEYHQVKLRSLTIDHLTFDFIIAFLDHLENDRKNIPRTRNQRLAVIKAFAKMIKVIYPEHREIAERILCIPKKRAQKTLVGFLYHDEVLKVFNAVDFKRIDGFRDYTILNLLYDSGARASEVATFKLDYFEPNKKTIAILGKGNRYRLIELWPRTVVLLNRYIKEYRKKPKAKCREYLFINQRGESLTRHGVYRICKLHLNKALPQKRLRTINPVHSFRHSCAINLLKLGYSITDIQNHLGHENIESTMVYTKLDIVRKKKIQDDFIKYTQSIITTDPNLDKLIDWENKEDILTWLDSL